MTRALLAAYPAAEPLLKAAKAAQASGAAALDAFTPYPVDGLAEALGLAPSRIPWAMLAGGGGGGAALYVLEWYSATRAYPFNLGGRPLDSWPAFIIAPVEFGVLGAAIAGFVALLTFAGLPRLNHPLFDHLALERVSQDQFILAFDASDSANAAALRRSAFDSGAIWIEETEL